ncbi:O-antigen ligase family protein [Sphingomonas sp. 3-13AW]|jgi:O-antigen ligase|uniref:O-antigen ligase family protein n=1 Tax=Sphingomonas sp. 3-13AW TaxID=3050450 RepID=UPI003BB786D7
MATVIGQAHGRPFSGAQPMGKRARRRYVVANFTFAIFLWLVLVGTAPLQEWAFQIPIGEGDAVNQILYVGVLLILLVGAGIPSKSELLCVPAALTLLLALCFLSVTWAIAPLISLRRVAQTAIVIWLVFRHVGDLGPARTLRLLRWAMILLLVINYLVVFYTPFGVHGEVFGEQSSVVGDWRGIIPHKNVAGAACALTILLFLFDNKQFPKIASALVIVAAANFLFFSNSRTSQVLLIPAMLLGFAIRPYSANHRTALGVFLLIVAAIAAQILSMNSAALAEIVNDPGTLTGRGSIWPLLIEYAREHPWTGAGFGSFWLIGDKSPIWTLTTGWVAVYAPHGHNGYLDLLVTMGIPGLVLGLIALAIWPLLRLLLSLSIPKPRRSLLLTLIAFCLGHNLTESSLLNGAALVEVFLIVAIAITYRESNASAGAHHRLRTRLTRILRRRQVLARR